MPWPAGRWGRCGRYALLLLHGQGHSATLTVGAGGYGSVSEAVAVATDGDEVLVTAGTWVECVDLADKDLTLTGAGAELTTIRGDGTCESALTLLGSTPDVVGTQTLTNNVFVENAVTQEGGGVYLSYQDDLSLTNNALVGNTAGDEGGALKARQAAFEATNNVVAWTVDGHGLVGRGSLLDAALRCCDWYEKTDVSGDIEVTIGADGNIAEDPGFVEYSADGDCTNDDLSLDAGSALIDAGDPVILDADGTVSDIGATGGPDAAPPDADGDRGRRGRPGLRRAGALLRGPGRGRLHDRHRGHHLQRRRGLRGRRRGHRA